MEEWLEIFNTLCDSYHCVGNIDFKLPENKAFVTIKYKDIEITRNVTVDELFENPYHWTSNIQKEIVHRILVTNR